MTRNQQTTRRSVAALCMAFLFALAFTMTLSWVRPALVIAQPGEFEDDDRLVSVVIELAQPAAAELYVAGMYAQQTGPVQMAAVTQAYVANLEQAQQALLAQLTQLDAQVQVLYRTQRVYNGIAVRVRPDQVAEIVQLDGVQAVHRLIPKQPTNSSSVRFIGAPQLWSAPYGLTGEGVTIAVIDTGLDYLHTDFGGPGTGYQQNDVTIIGDVSGFPSAKVIGGYDFVGDDYNANYGAGSYQSLPQPDPDPADCYGHGTHVAGTAAGYGVSQNGATYPGPYDSSAYSRPFKIGPGVAPLAKLYALKVFGCSGSSDIVDLAIEWAVDPNQDGDFSDHVDVINMSLGSTYGSLYDPTTVAAENAARIGVIVVASAGNSGDTYFTLGSPSNGDRVISVAASTESPIGSANLQENQEPMDTVASFSARGPRRMDAALKPDIAAPGAFIQSAQQGTGSSGFYASGTSMSAPHVAGSAALLRQLYPRNLPRGSASPAIGAIWNAEDIKALMMNTAIREIYSANSADAPLAGPTRIGAGRIDLPNALATNVIAYNGDNPGQVGLSFGAPEVLVSLEASKNLRVANKGTVTASYMISYVSLSDVPGVEFGLPASNTLTIPPLGVVNVPIQMRADATAMKHTRDAAVNDTQTYPRQWLSEEAGYLMLTPISASVSSALVSSALAEHELTVPDAPTPLHLPIYAAPRPAAQMNAVNKSMDYGILLEASQTITLAGIDLRGTDFPTDVVSMASFFELHLSSPNPSVVLAADADHDLYDHADLKYVGVATDYSPLKATSETAQSVVDATIFFGIATHGEWSSPNEVRFDIYIDTDEDGSADYRLFNADREGVLFGSAQVSDAFITALEKLGSFGRTSQEFLNFYSSHARSTAIFNSNVMVLPIKAAALGLDAANSDFKYYIESYSGDVANGSYVDRTQWHVYDVADAGLDVAGGSLGAPIYDDLDGATVEIGYRLGAYRRDDAKGLLIFHHHNIGDRRIEVVPILSEWPYHVFAPLVQAE